MKTSAGAIKGDKFVHKLLRLKEAMPAGGPGVMRIVTGSPIAESKAAAERAIRHYYSNKGLSGQKLDDQVSSMVEDLLRFETVEVAFRVGNA